MKDFALKRILTKIKLGRKNNLAGSCQTKSGWKGLGESMETGICWAAGRLNGDIRRRRIAGNSANPGRASGRRNNFAGSEIKNNRGMTFIETIFTIVVVGIAIMTLTMILVFSTVFHRKTTAQTDANNSASLALYSIADDLRRAINIVTTLDIDGDGTSELIAFQIPDKDNPVDAQGNFIPETESGVPVWYAYSLGNPTTFTVLTPEGTTKQVTTYTLYRYRKGLALKRRQVASNVLSLDFTLLPRIHPERVTIHIVSAGGRGRHAVPEDLQPDLTKTVTVRNEKLY